MIFAHGLSDLIFSLTPTKSHIEVLYKSNDCQLKERNAGLTGFMERSGVRIQCSELLCVFLIIILLI